MKPAIEAWLPKSILCLREYDRKTFVADAIAGITVGLVALPLAMAFAIASGLPPQSGIYCALVTGFLISALGGSPTSCLRCSAACAFDTSSPPVIAMHCEHGTASLDAHVDSGDFHLVDVVTSP